MDNSLTGQKNKRIKVVYNLVYITWSSVISLFKVQLTPGLIDSITLYIEQYLVSKPTALLFPQSPDNRMNKKLKVLTQLRLRKIVTRKG